MADVDLSDLMQAPEEKPGEVSPSGGEVPVELEDLIVEGKPLRWRDVPLEAIRNVPESGANLLRGIGQMIRHPVQTVGNVVQTGAGALSLLNEPNTVENYQEAADLYNRFRPPSEHKTAQQLLDEYKQGRITGPIDRYFSEGQEKARALGEYYRDRWDPATQGPKYTMARDPLGALADASILLGGGGGALRAAGASGRTAAALTKAGAALDPLNLAIKGAETVAKGTGSGLARVAGFTSGAGDTPVRYAYEAGVRGGDVNAAFRENLKGGSPVDIVNEAKAAVKQRATERGQDYEAGMAGVRADTTVLPMADVKQAVADVRDRGMFQGVVKDPAAQNTWSKIDAVVRKWENLNPAQYHTPAGMDALKQAIGSIRDASEYGTPGWNAASEVYNAIRGTITQQAPEYGRVMQRYETASAALDELNRTLALGRSSTTDSALGRLLSAETGAPRVKRREELLQDIDPTGKIGAGLSGMRLSELFPRQVAPGNVVTGLAGAGTSILGGTGLANPVLPVAAALSSPRVVGEVANLAGLLARYPTRAAEAAGRAYRSTVGELPASAIAEQVSLANQSPDELRDLIDKYRRPFGVPDYERMSETELRNRAGTPETLGEILGEPDAPVEGEQPDVGAQPAEDLSGASLGERNRNPGNIRDGEFAQNQPGYVGPGEGGFAQFDTMENGMAAQQVLLEKNYAGMTVDQIIDRYAPPNENSAESRANYKSYVAQRLGIGVDDVPTDMAALAAAMRAFETGNT